MYARARGPGVVPPRQRGRGMRCMSAGLACRCVAQHTRGVLGRKAAFEARRTAHAAGRLLSSTLCRRWRSDDRSRLALIRVDKQDVENPRVDHRKPASW